METPKNLIEAIRFFSDERQCEDLLLQTRWPDGIVKCPGANPLTSNTCQAKTVALLSQTTQGAFVLKPYWYDLRAQLNSSIHLVRCHVAHHQRKEWH